jgi:hypothetical protein
MPYTTGPELDHPLLCSLPTSVDGNSSPGIFGVIQIHLFLSNPTSQPSANPVHFDDEAEL